MKDFRELKVWQIGMELFEDVIKDVEKFPNTEVAKIIANQLSILSFRLVRNLSSMYEGFKKDSRQAGMTIR